MHGKAFKFDDFLKKGEERIQMLWNSNTTPHPSCVCVSSLVTYQDLVFLGILRATSPALVEILLCPVFRAVSVFYLRKKHGAPNFIRFPLLPDSLPLMQGAVQEDWLDCLPKDPA